MGDINDLYEEISKDEKLSDREKQELSAILDPVVWAETTLRNPEDSSEYLTLRKYQKNAISFQPYTTVNEEGESVLLGRIKVYRMGRRIGKTVILAVEALWKACTNSNYRILYIAPFESQCNLFFNIIEKLMTNTVLITKRFVRKPFIVQFHNGSTIMAHTANVRSSRKGSSIRGAEGDHIIIDEMDHGIDEVINEVIMPIYMGNDIATIVGSSTPCGRRGLFYLWCTEKNKLGIEEFYYTSKVSPKWNNQSEVLAKATMTLEQYTHEILAQFGEALEGVYRNVDLDFVMQTYELNKLKYNKNNVYIMGVDWNEKYGVCIIIIERSAKTGLYRVFKKEVIEKQKFTQLEGVNKIINIHLNECLCDFIYVDKGYGATQIELLQKYGLKNPSSNLHKIVKDIDYGGKIIIRDPVSGLEVGKPAKAYLVHNSQLMVEAHKIFIPEDEDTEHGVIGQMRNFRVSKFSSSGHPVYEGKLRGEDNDHLLNALLLALAGFTLEMSDATEYQTTNHITSLINFNIPKSPTRTMEIPSANVAKFRQLITQTMPNAKVFNSTSMLRKAGVHRQARTVAKIDYIKPQRPKRSNF